MDYSELAEQVQQARLKAARQWVEQFYMTQDPDTAAYVVRAIMNVKGMNQPLFLPRTRFAEDMKFFEVEVVDMLSEMEANLRIQTSERALAKVKTVGDLIDLAVDKVRRRIARQQKALQNGKAGTGLN
jgi:hypothetical protein